MSGHTTSADIALYRRFVEGQIQTLGKAPPSTLWHYTKGASLIKIVESGTFFSTQIACLNDATEYRYSVMLLHDAFKRLRPSFAGQSTAIYLLDYIDGNISTDTATSEWFVTCFSENWNDLSQWRAYGDGEDGYAIGFDIPELMSGILSNRCLLVPVHYDQSTHIRITDAVASATLRFFLQGWQAKQSLGLSIDQWMQSFFAAWVDEITYLAPAMKHPGFASECEWRIIHRLQPADIDNMEFLQKRTLMARHLPLAYRTVGASANSVELPIKEIMVGPSRHREISKISVADLLRTKGYPAAHRNVTVSNIPFQEV